VRQSSTGAAHRRSPTPARRRPCAGIGDVIDVERIGTRLTRAAGPGYPVVVDSTHPPRTPPPATPARVALVLIIAAAAATAIVVFTDAPGFVDLLIVLACALGLGLVARRMARRVRGRRRG
jgi:hypothetical protein